jgi:hypothetical protein
MWRLLLILHLLLLLVFAKGDRNAFVFEALVVDVGTRRVPVRPAGENPDDA